MQRHVWMCGKTVFGGGDTAPLPPVSAQRQAWSRVTHGACARQVDGHWLTNMGDRMAENVQTIDPCTGHLVEGQSLCPKSRQAGPSQHRQRQRHRPCGSPGSPDAARGPTAAGTCRPSRRAGRKGSSRSRAGRRWHFATQVGQSAWPRPSTSGTQQSDAWGSRGRGFCARMAVSVAASPASIALAAR